MLAAIIASFMHNAMGDDEEEEKKEVLSSEIEQEDAPKDIWKDDSPFAGFGYVEEEDYDDIRGEGFAGF
jgi:hypothetical protein